MRLAAFTLLLLGSFAGTAAAQAAPPPSSASTVGFRAFFAVDAVTAAASKSFDAVLGSSQLTGFGGGAEIDVWKNLFLRFSVTHMQKDGSRVFVDDGGQVFPLNIPLTVTMTPIEGGAGWRFPLKGRVTPYIGGGFVSVGYQETSDFAQAGDNVDERYIGGEGFGGVHVGVAKWMFVGGEAQYRHVAVPSSSSSVMQQFGESDLGGFTARFVIGFTTR